MNPPSKLGPIGALLLAAALGAGALVGCGDDDPAAPSPPGTVDDGGGNPEGDGGDPQGDSSTPTPGSSFPAYVKSLIDTKTADDGAPEAEAVWGAIPDDETPETAAALFPATYFQ